MMGSSLLSGFLWVGLWLGVEGQSGNWNRNLAAYKRDDSHLKSSRGESVKSTSLFIIK